MHKGTTAPRKGIAGPSGFFRYKIDNRRIVCRQSMFNYRRNKGSARYLDTLKLFVDVVSNALGVLDAPTQRDVETQLSRD